MYSTSPQISSLDNTFIRAVKLESIDEDRKPESLCGGWKNEFNTIAISIKIDDAPYNKECHKTLKASPQKCFWKAAGFAAHSQRPSLKPS